MNYQKIHDSIINKAKLRGLDKSKLNFYSEKHHIIPKSIGGLDSDDNLVLLTASEHFVVHQLLSKIYKKLNTKQYYSLLCAAKQLTINGKYTSRNNKEYSWIRTQLSKTQSSLYSGKGNPFYGKTHSIETKKMWSEKRKGSGSATYGKRRPHVSKIISEMKRGPQWKYYDELKELWNSNGNIGYVKFRKLAIKLGYPDISYQKIIDDFRRV